jgi:hypothetical protein
MQAAGKYIIVVGVLVILVGLILMLFGNKLSWLGHLPGDIKVERENFKFYFPITTMILLSSVISAIVWLVRKFTG